jgi:hypothetical protein
VGSEILQGIKAELKRSKDISASQKSGTAVTSPDKILDFSFSAEKSQWLQV